MRNDMSVINNILKDVPIPKVVKVRQKFDANKIEDVSEYMKRELRSKGLQQKIKPGMSIAVGAGSRGIDNHKEIVKEVVDFLKECGAEPFVFPAMGSHAGANAQGQKEMLAGYGITEEYLGCPVRATMETVVAGRTEDGLEVYTDLYASQADGIVVINRIKPHTAFRGTYESGLFKMLTIGMGKQRGAKSMHEAGYQYFAERIPLFAKIVMRRFPVLFGVGIVENAFDKTAYIEAIPAEQIAEREPELLKMAFSKMAQLYLPETDILIVKEIGKNISGSGMDPNITGRWPSAYASGGLKSQKVGIMRLSELSHGNFMGLGHAEATTRACFDELDFAATYPNALTNTVMFTSRIPVVLDTEKLVIQALINGCVGIDKQMPRMIFIKNTMEMETIYVSEAHLEEVRKIPSLEILEEAEKLKFNEAGECIFNW